MDTINNTDAEKLMKAWNTEYELKQGALKPFTVPSEIETKYSEIKSIPHYLFDDMSVIAEYINGEGETELLLYCDESELDSHNSHDDMFNDVVSNIKINNTLQKDNKINTVSEAEQFLKKWSKDYEDSHGEISAPEFSNICEYSDVKNIPFQRFDDNSIVIVYIDWLGKIRYEAFDDDTYLDQEWDMEWSINNNDYKMLNVWQ